MLVPVRCECETCQDWTLIELQGEVDVQDSFKNDLQNLKVGTLCQSQTDKPILRIGYHELEGKLVVLKKPFAVLRKLTSVSEDAEGDSKATSFDVVGVIRQKYLFKTRPRPLISIAVSAAGPEPKLKKIKAG